MSHSTLFIALEFASKTLNLLADSILPRLDPVSMVTWTRHAMPALQRIIPSRGKEFWDPLDSDNMKQVLEAVKEEVKLCVRLVIQDLISA